MLHDTIYHRGSMQPHTGSPQWKDINTLALEIGYPGRGGQTLWKESAGCATT